MICIDSDCIIDFLKDNSKAAAIVEKYNWQLLTTAINIHEVLLGEYIKEHPNKRREASAQKLFASVEILPLTSSASMKAARILADLMKAGKTVQQTDVFIAAIMLENGCNTIITRNAKHYSLIKGIKVISY